MTTIQVVPFALDFCMDKLGKSQTFSPVTVANHWINGHGVVGFVKLQKLVYCAHGWWLALQGEPLINEVPQAWDMGPVFPTLYHARKGYEAGERIPGPDASMSSILEDFLDAVYDRYGQFSGQQMVALTHAHGAPWHKVAGKYVAQDLEIPHDLEIPNHLIKQHFASLREKSKQYDG